MPNHNERLFRRNQALLACEGHDAIIPHDISPYEPSKEWADYMRECIPALLTCDAISMLPGWEKSKGASLEYEVAKALDMIIL